jgi:hypothetical protein
VDQQGYGSEEIPDLIELRKKLSDTNKLRHEFWTKLRVVRNQVGRYIRAHQVSSESLETCIEKAPEEAKDYFRNEWEAGRAISTQELNKMWHQ